VLAAVLIAGAAWYLFDPPWIADMTAGILNWEEQPPGTRYRITKTHATLFVPSSATSMTLPLRSWFPGPGHVPVIVSVSVDDRWLANVSLPNENDWVTTTLPLPRRHTFRRHRRVDLRASRTVAPFSLGFLLGVVKTE